MSLLYEEKENIHQEEMMYTVFILGLRKHSKLCAASQCGTCIAMRHQAFDVPTTYTRFSIVGENTHE